MKGERGEREGEEREGGREEELEREGERERERKGSIISVHQKYMLGCDYFQAVAISLR